MSFQEFQCQARLYVVGALENDELRIFSAARKRFGPKAEQVIDECQKLAAAFALTLQPLPPSRETKQRLLALIQGALHDR